MTDPTAKNRKVIDAAGTKFEFAVTIRGEPLLAHDVRITLPHGNSLDVPAKALLQFAVEAFVAPARTAALNAAIEDGDFPSILLGKI